MTIVNRLRNFTLYEMQARVGEIVDSPTFEAHSYRVYPTHMVYSPEGEKGMHHEAELPGALHPDCGEYPWRPFPE